MRNRLLCSLAVKVQGLAICLIATLVFASVVLAQTQITTGTIQGTVVDENKAAVPGASVEITNVETNLTRNLNTDEEGSFVALTLPPGRYRVTVTKQGFAKLVVPEANLTVGQALTLPLTMKVSGVEEVVTVTDTPTIDTVKTESSTTLDERAVGNTPILGRKFEDLLTLTPGVSITQGPDGDEINFVGQRGIKQERPDDWPIRGKRAIAADTHEATNLAVETLQPIHNLLNCNFLRFRFLTKHNHMTNHGCLLTP